MRVVKMSLLTADFEAKSEAKLKMLLGDKNGATSASPCMEVYEEPQRDVSLSDEISTDVMRAMSEVVVNEKLVKLTEVGGRKAVLKDCPASLDLVASEEDINKFSLEALKKLAKTASLEIPKQANKPTVVALLVDAYRRGNSRGEEMREEETPACCLR
jgi:hypothetical protein